MCKMIDGGKLLGALWRPKWVSWGWGGREVQEEEDICIPIADSEKAMAPHSSTLAWKIPWAIPWEIHAKKIHGKIPGGAW